MLRTFQLAADAVKLSISTVYRDPPGRQRPSHLFSSSVSSWLFGSPFLIALYMEKRRQILSGRAAR